MGNAVGSVINGVGQVIRNILGHPLEFLSGKSCESKCGSTWDVICYIENFCVSRLLKLAMVAMLVYIVLLFLYLLFNLGICQCICQTLCRIIWTFFSTDFSALHFCCSYLCHKLRAVKTNRRRRRRRRRDVEEFVDHPSSSSEDDYELRELGETSSFQQKHRNHENGRSQVSRRKDYKNERLRRSLRPNTHRARVELSGDSIHLHRKRNIGDHSSPIHHHLRVTRSSRFSQKGSRRRARIHHKKK